MLVVGPALGLWSAFFLAPLWRIEGVGELPIWWLLPADTITIGLPALALSILKACPGALLFLEFFRLDALFALFTQRGQRAFWWRRRWWSPVGSDSMRQTSNSLLEWS